MQDHRDKALNMTIKCEIRVMADEAGGNYLRVQPEAYPRNPACPACPACPYATVAEGPLYFEYSCCLHHNVAIIGDRVYF